MRNNTRRNRNIGTAKQGYGQNNRLTIAEPIYDSDFRSFLERLGTYKKSSHVINGHEFIFVVEDTYPDFYHACSVEDVISVLKRIPVEDFGDLKFIVFRQPKRKEKILNPAWGRLVYSYEFENDYAPAVILLATPKQDILKWNKDLSVEAQKELNRLKEDGHVFIEEKRFHEALLLPEAVRNTQLYRTLPHEIGHYVHYLEVVERPIAHLEDIDFDKYLDERNIRWNFYHDSIPKIEKEKFAHGYADRMREELLKHTIDNPE